MNDDSLNYPSEEHDSDDEELLELTPKPLRLVHNTRAKMIVLWIALAVWLGFSANIYFDSFSSGINWESDWPICIICGIIFPGGALLILVFSIIALIKWRKFGESYFDIPLGHAVLGKELVGTIRTSVELKPTADYNLTLECLEVISTKSSSGKNRNKTHSRWRSEQTLKSTLYRSRSGIPVKFKIPSDCLGLNDKRAAGAVEWVLTLGAATRGFNYESHFSVPIYPTECGI